LLGDSVDDKETVAEVETDSLAELVKENETEGVAVDDADCVSVDVPDIDSDCDGDSVMDRVILAVNDLEGEDELDSEGVGGVVTENPKDGDALYVADSVGVDDAETVGVAVIESLLVDDSDHESDAVGVAVVC
jgi:hypothetical protein